MLAYDLQVSELEKIARLEGRVPEPRPAPAALVESELPRGVECLVCGEPAAGACDGCRSIFYCSPEHQALDARFHDGVCALLEQARQDTAFRASGGLEELVRQRVSRTREQAPASRPLTWDDYLEPTASAEPVARRLLADLASRPLTLAQLLDQLALTSGTIRVHLIGASSKELEACELFGELPLFFPGLSLDLTFVGIELPDVRHRPVDGVNMRFHTGEYLRDFWSRGPRPDLVVGFNAGLLVYRSWIPTLRELLGSGAHVAITSYRGWEARGEAELLRSVGVTCLHPPAENRFRSPVWRRSSTVANDLSQDNAFVSVWRF